MLRPRRRHRSSGKSGNGYSSSSAATCCLAPLRAASMHTVRFDPRHRAQVLSCARQHDPARRGGDGGRAAGIAARGGAAAARRPGWAGVGLRFGQPALACAAGCT
eukprot:4928546-Prymnesium_polylepis.1